MSYELQDIPQPNRTSKRRYRRFWVNGNNPTDYGGALIRPGVFTGTLFIDEVSGLVTADIGKFEAWASCVEKVPPSHIPDLGCYLENCACGDH